MKQRTIVGLVLIGVWTLALILWPVTSNSPDSVATRQTMSTGEGLYKSDITEAHFGILGARFFESSGGERSWNIRSAFAELHRQEQSYAFMKEVDADFFTGRSNNVIHSKSDFGRSHFGRRLVELQGNVVVQSDHGYRFTMDRLDYHSAAHRFSTVAPIQMVGPDARKPDMFLNGVGLDADLNEENFFIHAKTRARRRLQTNEWIHIESQEGEFQPQKNRAIFKRQVSARLPELSIRSERLEMNVGGTAGEVLHAIGKVQLIHKDRKGKSQRADIEVGGDRVILEGEASVVTEDNILNGERITLYTNDDRVEVQQAEGSLRP